MDGWNAFTYMFCMVSISCDAQIGHLAPCRPDGHKNAKESTDTKAPMAPAGNRRMRMNE